MIRRTVRRATQSGGQLLIPLTRCRPTEAGSGCGDRPDCRLQREAESLDEAAASCSGGRHALGEANQDSKQDEDVLKTTDNPPARADFQYGRPMKGHGWQPMPNPEIIRMMAERSNKTSPGMVVTR